MSTSNSSSASLSVPKEAMKLQRFTTEEKKALMVHLSEMDDKLNSIQVTLEEFSKPDEEDGEEGQEEEQEEETETGEETEGEENNKKELTMSEWELGPFSQKEKGESNQVQDTNKTETPPAKKVFSIDY